MSATRTITAIIPTKVLIFELEVELVFELKLAKLSILKTLEKEYKTKKNITIIPTNSINASGFMICIELLVGLYILLLLYIILYYQKYNQRYIKYILYNNNNNNNNNIII